MPTGAAGQHTQKSASGGVALPRLILVGCSMLEADPIATALEAVLQHGSDLPQFSLRRQSAEQALDSLREGHVAGLVVWEGAPGWELLKAEAEAREEAAARVVRFIVPKHPNATPAKGWIPLTDLSAAALRTMMLLLQRQVELEAEWGRSYAEIQRAEGRLRRVIERHVDAVLMIDREGVIRLANPAAETMFQRADSALVGSPFGFPVCRSESVEVHVLRADGGTCWAEMRSEEMDWEGELFHLVSLRDITARRDAALELARAERTMRSVLDSLDAMICVLNRDGAIVLVNRAWERNAEENGDPNAMSTGIGINYLCILDAAIADGSAGSVEVRQGLMSVLRGESKLFTTQLPCMRLSGPSYFEMRITPLDVPGESTPGGAVVSYLDITDQVLARDRERRLEDQLVRTQKLESLGILAGGIAHDFNNMLVGILGNVELAKPDVKDPALAESLAAIERSALRGTDIVRQLLAYAGRGDFRTSRLDLNGVVEESSLLLRGTLGRAAAIEYRLSPKPIFFHGEPGSIRQVIMNLVTNACEACAGRAGVVTVATGRFDADEGYLRSLPECFGAQPGPYVFVEVRDNGGGIAAETRGRIFEPFFSTKADAGHGLGLSVVRGIVKSHRGAIEVESSPGMGTRFRVLLPEIRIAEEPPASPPAAPNPARGLVLVADAEDSSRQMLRAGLEEAGFGVVLAANRETAASALRDRLHPVDLVVVSSNVGGVGFGSLIEECRMLAPAAPVIALVPEGETVAARRDLAAVLVKPFRMAEVVALASVWARSGL